VDNEGNAYPVADPSRMRISMSNELNEEPKERPREDLKKDLKEEFMEEFSKNIKITKTEKLENPRKQLNELREDFNKL
jgi:hypothetical protein